MDAQLLASVTNIKQIEHPQMNVGDLVSVHQKVKEGNKERVQIFEGLIINIGGTGINRTITVRRISGGFGVEKVFPVNLPTIVKITVKRNFKVRRANLSYVRGLSGKGLRFKEIKKDKKTA